MFCQAYKSAGLKEAAGLTLKSNTQIRKKLKKKRRRGRGSRTINNQTCDPSDRERLLQHPDFFEKPEKEKITNLLIFAKIYKL
jgi:hypothetical protein